MYSFHSAHPIRCYPPCHSGNPSLNCGTPAVTGVNDYYENRIIISEHIYPYLQQKHRGILRKTFLDLHDFKSLIELNLKKMQNCVKTAIAFVGTTYKR